MIITAFGAKLDETKIRSVEKQLGIHLPEDYVRFLLAQNGGEPDGNYAFSFFEQGVPEKTDTVLKCFYDINCGDDFDPNDIVSSYRALVDSSQIPEGYLPFAEDVFGNYILLSCNNGQFGNVYFGNSELENVETGYIAMSLVSDSFTSFINGLHIMEEY